MLLHTRGSQKMTPPSPFWGSIPLYMHELPRRVAAVSTTYEGFELLGRLLSVLDGTKHFKSVRMPSKHSALNHFCGGNALVKMSAACSFVSMYLISTDGSSMHSFKELRFILCVRLMCRSLGEKPFLTTRIVAWLSSCMTRLTSRPRSLSHSCSEGSPS